MHTCEVRLSAYALPCEAGSDLYVLHKLLPRQECGGNMLWAQDALPPWPPRRRSGAAQASHGNISAWGVPSMEN